MQTILAIAIAGAAGCLSRYWLSLGVNRALGHHFPYGILVVNIVGCLLIGLLDAILIERLFLAPIWRTTLLIGFLGGFTTFSSFSLDTIKLLETGDYLKALIYVLLSVFVCLAATVAGLWLGRNITI